MAKAKACVECPSNNAHEEGREWALVIWFFFYIVSNRGKNDLMKRSFHVLEQKTNVIEELLMQCNWQNVLPDDENMIFSLIDQTKCLYLFNLAHEKRRNFFPSCSTLLILYIFKKYAKFYEFLCLRWRYQMTRVFLSYLRPSPRHGWRIFIRFWKSFFSKEAHHFDILFFFSMDSLLLCAFLCSSSSIVQKPS